MLGDDAPAWAFALTPPGFVAAAGDPTPQHVPGSTRAYTHAQVEDNFNPPDWFPDEHPPMPAVVAHGDGPIVWACAKCHLASGSGHPESASLAGLPAAYLAEQIAAYKSGARKGSAKMVQIAQAMSDDDTRESTEWFSRLPRRRWIVVAETANVPATFIAEGNMRLRAPGEQSEPIADRIIELPQDQDLARLRDPHSGFVASVPPGSIARGSTLVHTGGGVTIACSSCHGASLTGLGPYPSIAGRSPTYIVRQLYDFKTGVRTGAGTELMAGVVSGLSTADMVAIAAYLATLDP